MNDKKNRKRRGFTLIELVVVIAILGILVAIAVPKLGGSREKAAISAHNANVRTLESAATMYIADNGNPTSEKSDSGTGDIAAYVQEWPKPPKGTGVSAVESATTYTVKISTDGKVTVIPAKIETPEETAP
ncbi:type II secretion system protein [Mahella australiensis]|nr:prepilin-type N-terminal cleavage/methylation domain-containing protein [Mahella australiensis]